jgi:hypothetical protein
MLWLQNLDCYQPNEWVVKAESLPWSGAAHVFNEWI